MSGRDGLKILMTADTVGGVWQYAVELSASLAKAGHRIVLAVLGPAPSDDQARVAERLAGVELRVTGWPLDWLSSGPEPVEQAARALARLAREERVDLVHCNMPTLVGAAQFPVPVVAVTHGCVATWWQAANAGPLAPEFRWHKDMMRQGLRAADVVVAPSASYAATIKLAYRLPKLPRVVYNGRTPPSLRPTGAPLRAALTVGRQWDRVKNAALLDRVAARLSAPFLAAGALRGPHGEEARLGHLQPLGHVGGDNLSYLLEQRPVFVSAATFEPFGLAVLEAAQAGCPLVLSDISTFRELWDGAALFAEPHDEDGFVEAIERLLAERDLADRMGRAAAERATRFTPAATAFGMEQIYAHMLRQTEAAA